MNELLNFVRVTNGFPPIPDDQPVSIWFRRTGHVRLAWRIGDEYRPYFFSVFWKPVTW